MARKYSKRLVIDASVAHASGGEGATFPTSRKCRDFLKAVYEICHRIVLSPLISEEWSRHQSTFARAWLTAMRSRGKIEDVEHHDRNSLKESVVHLGLSARDQEAILKDLHLVNAALDTDFRVISLDEVVRKLLTNLAPQIPQIAKVVWVNPDHDDEVPQQWLAAGAKMEGTRRLLER